MWGYRVRKGDRLQVVVPTNPASDTLVTRFRILYDNGTQDVLSIDPFASGTTAATFEGINRAHHDGWVVGGILSSTASTTTRGQVYVQVFTTDGSASTLLCRGWVYAGHPLQLGENVERLNVLNSNVIPTAGTTIGDTSIVGDTIFLDSGDIAGNVTISIPTATPSAVQLWEVREVLWTMLCDATVANRLPTPVLSSGLPIATGTAVSGDFVFAASLPSLQASQSGRMFCSLSPSLVQLNDNGTITTGNTSPLPVLVNPQSFTLSCAVAAGVAGDLHRMVAVMRRVA